MLQKKKYLSNLDLEDLMKTSSSMLEQFSPEHGTQDSRKIETASLQRVLSSGVFSEVSKRIQMASAERLRLVPSSFFLAAVPQDEMWVPRAWEGLILPIGMSREKIEKTLKDCVFADAARVPAGFRALARSSGWQAFAKPNGNVPRLLLPGVMIEVESDRFEFPVIDYIRTEDRDAPLEFVLNSLPLDRLSATGARALFARTRL